jgi:hypothetical protein
MLDGLMKNGEREISEDKVPTGLHALLKDKYNSIREPGVVVHTYNLSFLESEVGSLWYKADLEKS